MQAKQIWQVALGDLARVVSPANFETWLRTTQMLSFDDDCATIGAPNSFAVEQLRGKFAVQIQETLGVILGRPVAVQFTTMSAANDEGTLEAEPKRGRRSGNSSAAVHEVAEVGEGSYAAPQLHQLELEAVPENGLNPRYVFEKFIVGSNNRLAHAAALAVADRPADKFNPLYIYGGVGLGKTHLLHAIGHRALSRNPALRIRYISSETFTNEMVNAIRLNRNEDFRARYRTIDILMVDDIQFIAGKESTQEEFFHTFNALHQSGKQIVLSSDRPPRAIPTLADRLRSRFEGGLQADVQAPDLETREAILAEKGREMNLVIPSDVLLYVSQKVESNIRELEGALNKIIALSQLYNRKLSVELAVEALTDSALASRRRDLSADEVVDTVIGYYQISRRDILGPARRRDIVVPRQVAMFLLREETQASLVQIGHCLGRDHSTVMHGIEKIETRIAADQQLRGDVLAIKERLYAAGG